MCALIAIVHRVPGYPAVLGANRDELRDRGGLSPAIFRGRRLAVLCPRDRRAGGTWIGMNEKGLVGAVTNRPGPVDPGMRSRGQLLLDLLAQPSAAGALEWLERDLRRARYNPFNVLLADEVGSTVAHVPKGESGGSEFRPLEAGVHILTNLHDVDTLPVDGLANAGDVERVEDAFENLKTFLGDHTARGAHVFCRHGGDRGTLSSTLVAVSGRGLEGAFFLHAEGTPCATAFRDHSKLARHLASAEDRQANRDFGGRGEPGSEEEQESVDGSGDRPRRSPGPSGRRGR
ncbi:MAG TPA: NRDE family protein [Planctomycetota bacterium]|nr:NRDE family protein [Planctomycetota bacterium]